MLPPPGTKKSTSVMLLPIALNSRDRLNALKIVPYVGLLNTFTSASPAGGAWTNPVPSVVKSAPPSDQEAIERGPTDHRGHVGGVPAVPVDLAVTARERAR